MEFFLKTALKTFWLKFPIYLLLFPAVLPYVTLLLPNECHHRLLREDGVFETASAVLWFLASCICFYLYATDRLGNDLILFKTRRNLFLFLLAIAFFLGFGEEISWGQRIFDIPTPEPLKEINEQGEMNIHNLAGFHVEQLFSLFWFSYAFVTPLAARVNRQFAGFVNRVNLPLIPLGTGILFPVNYLISKLFQPHFTGAEENFPIEAKEFVFALLFLIAALEFLKKAQTGRVSQENG